MDTRILTLSFLTGALASALIVGTLSRFAIVMLRHFVDRATPHARLGFWLNFLGKVSGFEWCNNCNSFHPDEQTEKEIVKRGLLAVSHGGCWNGQPGPAAPADEQIAAASLAALMDSLSEKQLLEIGKVLDTPQKEALINLHRAMINGREKPIV